MMEPGRLLVVYAGKNTVGLCRVKTVYKGIATDDYGRRWYAQTGRPVDVAYKHLRVTVATSYHLERLRKHKDRFRLLALLSEFTMPRLLNLSDDSVNAFERYALATLGEAVASTKAGDRSGDLEPVRERLSMAEARAERSFVPEDTK